MTILSAEQKSPHTGVCEPSIFPNLTCHYAKPIRLVVCIITFLSCFKVWHPIWKLEPVGNVSLVTTSLFSQHLQSDFVKFGQNLMALVIVVTGSVPLDWYCFMSVSTGTVLVTIHPFTQSKTGTN